MVKKITFFIKITLSILLIQGFSFATEQIILPKIKPILKEKEII